MKLAGHHFDALLQLKLAERVSPSSCTQQCPVIFFHVPFDFAVGHCNLVRKDEAQPPCPSARTWTWRWCHSNSKGVTVMQSTKKPRCAAHLPETLPRRPEMSKRFSAAWQKNSWNLSYTKNNLSKTKCHSKSFLLLYSWTMHNLQRSVSKKSMSESRILYAFHGFLPIPHASCHHFIIRIITQSLPDRAITKGGLGLTGATPRRKPWLFRVGGWNPTQLIEGWFHSWNF